MIKAYIGMGDALIQLREYEGAMINYRKAVMCGVCFCGDTTGDEDDMCAELSDFLWDYHKGGVCIYAT